MFFPITPEAGTKRPRTSTPLVFTPPKRPPTGLGLSCTGMPLLHTGPTGSITGACSEYTVMATVDWSGQSPLGKEEVLCTSIQLPCPAMAGLKLVPDMPCPLQAPVPPIVNGARLMAGLVLQRSGSLLVMVAGIKASTLMYFVSLKLQVGVPIKYCTALFPTAASDGVNTPVLLRNDEETQCPVAGFTESCTASPVLHTGEICVISGCGGLSTGTIKVL